MALSDEPVWGMPFGVKPLLQYEDELHRVARDVATAIRQHPNWEAGPALLCFLEAERGNLERSVELLAPILEDKSKPIPRESAWVFGLALQGKSAELDQLVIQLYEKSLENWPIDDLRRSPLYNLAKLYRKVGRDKEASDLLDRLKANGSRDSSIEGFLKAKDVLAQAKQQEKSGEFAKSADAYLEAYRLDPSLLRYDQFATIKKAQRTREFVEVFTVDRLKKVPQFGHGSDGAKLKIVRDLLLDDATCLDGNVFLKNMWVTTNTTARWYLLNPPYNRIWPNVIDTTFLIRDGFLPADIPAEGAGWDRFTLDIAGDSDDSAFGAPQYLRLLLDRIPQKKVSLSKLAREVEAKTQQFPDWKVGVAVQGLLEAELGNQQRAVELFEKMLSDPDEPIPPKSAWVFGLALEGKSVALDQIVMRLYEINLDDGERSAQGKALCSSAIRSLARLYAKYDRRDDARQLLLRLTEPEGPHFGGKRSQFVLCSYSSQFGIIRKNEAGYTVLPEDKLPKGTCIQCHRKERNLENYFLMANGLTDVGFPVEARLALTRIDASFYNAHDSDAAWAKANTSLPSPEYYGAKVFQPIRAKAEGTITPQVLLNALESGVTIESDMKRSVIAAPAARIDLMLGVRGVNGKSTLFSPVIDMLAIAAKAKGDEAAIANVKIDQLLSEAFDKNPDNVEAGIAATIFAFLRNDFDNAEKRLQKLEELVDGKESQDSDLSLWLVARLALAGESTRAIGEKLADRALTSAGKQSDPRWKEAILGSWEPK